MKYAFLLLAVTTAGIPICKPSVDNLNFVASTVGIVFNITVFIMHLFYTPSLSKGAEDQNLTSIMDVGLLAFNLACYAINIASLFGLTFPFSNLVSLICIVYQCSTDCLNLWDEKWKLSVAIQILRFSKEKKILKEKMDIMSIKKYEYNDEEEIEAKKKSITKVKEHRKFMMYLPIIQAFVNLITVLINMVCDRSLFVFDLLLFIMSILSFAQHAIVKGVNMLDLSC